MSPSLPSITRARYWIVVALRIVAAILFAWAVVLVWMAMARLVQYQLLERGAGGDHLIRFVAVELLIGPVPVALGALACVRLGPAIARWLVPLPPRGCPECGYPAPPRAQRCPECGAPMVA